MLVKVTKRWGKIRKTRSNSRAKLRKNSRKVPVWERLDSADEKIELSIANHEGIRFLRVLSCTVAYRVSLQKGWMSKSISHLDKKLLDRVTRDCHTMALAARKFHVTYGVKETIYIFVRPESSLRKIGGTVRAQGPLLGSRNRHLEAPLVLFAFLLQFLARPILPPYLIVFPHCLFPYH